MAHNSEKIFAAVHKLLAANGRAPSKTAICQSLIADGVVNSMGTAHKYVGAFFAADALKAEFRAPEADVSELPHRVRSAYDALVTASDVLRNEVAVALEDLTRESSVTFGKMMAAHNTAQQSEIEELVVELDRAREETNTLETQLAEERERCEAIAAELAERIAEIGAANTLAMELRTSLEAEQGKVASLSEALDSKNQVVAALESERLMRDRRDAQTDQEIASLREQNRELRAELEKVGSSDTRVAGAAFSRQNAGEKPTATDTL